MARNRGCQAAKYAKPGLITARRPADMVGNLAATVAAGRRAEPGDLGSAGINRPGEGT